MSEKMEKNRKRNFRFETLQLHAGHTLDIILDEKLHRARQLRFLFLESQYINKPIKYLRYNTKRHYPVQPLMDTSHIVIESPCLNLDNPTPELTTPSSSTCIDTTSNIMQQNFIVPDHLLPFVPNESISAETVQHNQHLDDESNRARMLGTSVNKLDQREFDDDDPDEFKNSPVKLKKLKRKEKLIEEYKAFNLNYFSVINPIQHHYRYKDLTSDDTKALELRPHKRDPYTSTNLDSHWCEHIDKKLCPDKDSLIIGSDLSAAEEVSSSSSTN
ncbi:hypothetical protein C1646_757189 [Rhizophagus diaphanus]|nr:hypothetical protein C1646_757189 [Rhizophagus diaphanus] [Rhizophagus sp. MUCL 43196]